MKVTCYASGVIGTSWATNFALKGCTVTVYDLNQELLDHAKKLAKQRGCKAITLDSGLPRTGAHGFYEHYGFEKSCYGFELTI